MENTQAAALADRYAGTVRVNRDEHTARTVAADVLRGTDPQAAVDAMTTRLNNGARSVEQMATQMEKRGTDPAAVATVRDVAARMRARKTAEKVGA